MALASRLASAWRSASRSPSTQRPASDDSRRVTPAVSAGEAELGDEVVHEGRRGRPTRGPSRANPCGRRRAGRRRAGSCAATSAGRPRGCGADPRRTAPGSPRVTSRLVRITASGLRSSWDASWMNCFWLSKASSMRSSMASKVSARSRSSSCGPPRSMRRDRSVAWISLATSVMRPMGRSTRPAANQPTTRLMRNSTSRASERVRRGSSSRASVVDHRARRSRTGRSSMRTPPPGVRRELDVVRWPRSSVSSACARRHVDDQHEHRGDHEQDARVEDGQADPDRAQPVRHAARRSRTVPGRTSPAVASGHAGGSHRRGRGTRPSPSAPAGSRDR